MAATNASKTKKKQEENELLLATLQSEYAKLKDMPLKKQLVLAMKNQRVMAKYYSTEKRVQVRISPLYKPYFGNVMAIKLNGIPIYVPCNNDTFEIPESYAMEWASRMRKVDDQIQREKRLGNVRHNYDGQTAGGANLIKAI